MLLCSLNRYRGGVLNDVMASGDYDVDDIEHIAEKVSDPLHSYLMLLLEMLEGENAGVFLECELEEIWIDEDSNVALNGERAETYFLRYGRDDNEEESDEEDECPSEDDDYVYSSKNVYPCDDRRLTMSQSPTFLPLFSISCTMCRFGDWREIPRPRARLPCLLCFYFEVPPSAANGGLSYVDLPVTLTGVIQGLLRWVTMS